MLAVPTDVTKDADVQNLFAQTIKTFGRCPDVVLSNAGAVEVGPMGEQGTDVWWGILVCMDETIQVSEEDLLTLLTRAST